jgi:hypothetical protein
MSNKREEHRFPARGRGTGFLPNPDSKKPFSNFSSESTLDARVVSDERRIPERANRALPASRQARGSLHRKAIARSGGRVRSPHLRTRKGLSSITGVAASEAGRGGQLGRGEAWRHAGHCRALDHEAPTTKTQLNEAYRFPQGMRMCSITSAEAHTTNAKTSRDAMAIAKAMPSKSPSCWR